MQNKDILVLDLETKKSFDEVGGQENYHLLGISLAGVYSFNQDKFFGFLEHEINILEKMLKEARLVIGFNTLGFDYKVLKPYVSFDPQALPSLDILKEIYDQVGHRVSLNSVAQMTLGQEKSSHGLEAIKMFREGRLDDLKKYCLDDVRITRDIYLFGRDNGRIIFNSKTGIKSLLVNWQIEKILKSFSVDNELINNRKDYKDNNDNDQDEHKRENGRQERLF